MAEQTTKQRVGLFGGSFNPPHYGHFIAAFYAYHFLGLDEVWMMVSPQNPLKDPAQYAALADRKELYEILAAEHPWLKVTDVEKNFASTQTADTLKKMKELNPDIEFVWIMGADNLAHFHEWNRWQEIIDNHAIAVLARTGDSENAVKSKAAKYAASLQVKNPLDLQGKTKGWCFIDVPSFDISSSSIVDSLKNGQRTVRDLPEKIEAHILQKGLYGTAPPMPPTPNIPGP